MHGIIQFSWANLTEKAGQQKQTVYIAQQKCHLIDINHRIISTYLNRYAISLHTYLTHHSHLLADSWVWDGVELCQYWYGQQWFEGITYNRFPSMSYFQQIMAEFARVGCRKEDRLTSHELNNILDRISTANAGVRSFDRDIAEQLWDHSNKTNNKVELKDYIQTIIDARNILTENIAKCQKHLAFPQTPNRAELEDCILSYRQDIETINKTFKLEGVPTERPTAAPAPAELTEINSKIFSDDVSPREQSLSLRYALYLTILLLACQLFCLFVRHHFINLMAYLAVLAIYFLKYFDSTYLRTVLAILLIATASDILWVFLHATHYWSLADETQYSHLQGGILGLVVILAVSAAFGKLLLFVLLFRFRSNLPSTRKLVTLCGNTIQLNGQPHNNPVSRLLLTPGNEL